MSNSKFAPLTSLTSRIGEPVEPNWTSELREFAKYHTENGTPMSIDDCSPAHVNRYTGEKLGDGKYAQQFKIHFNDLLAEYKKSKSAWIAKSAQAQIADILETDEAF